VGEPAVLAALRIEALALGGPVVVTGVGRARSSRVAGRKAAALPAGAPAAVAGVAGGLGAEVLPGDLVVATELRTTDGTPARPLPAAALVAAELRRGGLRVHEGPVVSVESVARGQRRAELATSGALAVDMESAFVADALGARPLVVVRAVADTARRGPVRGGLRALGALRRVRPVLDRWGVAVGPREVVLAAPRSFCAGVERAIDIVERAIERFGPPVYVRRQIVHNLHVVRELEGKGAVFVEELDEVPDGATVVLAAHGVSPEVRRQAESRPGLSVIDATCPLVAKVHQEAKRYAARGYRIALVGHGDHEEVVGTLGEAPEHIHLVERPEDVDRLTFGPDEPVAYLTQTTLATDETAEIVAALQRRYPHVVGPHADDICYATQNRQDAVRALAPSCDLVLVVGSSNSSNTARLVEVARRAGCRAELVEDGSEVRLEWLDGVRRVGLTAGASAPDALVHQVVDALRALGPVEVAEHRTTEEHVRFSLPVQVR